MSEEQQSAISRFTALALPLPMPADVKADYLSLVAQERLRTRTMATVAGQMNHDVDTLGYTPEPKAQRDWILNFSATAKYCRSLAASPAS